MTDIYKFIVMKFNYMEMFTSTSFLTGEYISISLYFIYLNNCTCLK